MRRFCADTSALVAAWVERYPPNHFPSLWDKIATLIRADRLFAPDEVRNELLKRSKEVVEWLDAFDGFFRSTDEGVLLGASAILAKFPKLVMERKVAFAADPFVIALAQIENSTVLTEEGMGSAGRPKIPFVCHDQGIECVGLLDVIRNERWVIGTS